MRIIGASEGVPLLGFRHVGSINGRYPSFFIGVDGSIFVLNDLFVDALARRKGGALKLLSAAVAFAIAEGAVRVSLSTAVTNTTAQALYQSAGWKRNDAFFVYDFVAPA